MGRRLSKVFKEDKVDGMDILLNFLLEVKQYKSLPLCMVWRMLYFGRTPPFSLRLPGDSNEQEGQETGWKRENGKVQEMERKRAKSS